MDQHAKEEGNGQEYKVQKKKVQNNSRQNHLTEADKVQAITGNKQAANTRRPEHKEQSGREQGVGQGLSTQGKAQVKLIRHLRGVGGSCPWSVSYTLTVEGSPVCITKF